MQRLGQEVELLEEGGDYFEGKIYLARYPDGKARYKMNVGSRAIKSDFFPFDEQNPTADERDELEYILRVRETGWHMMEDFSKIEYSCVYCGALAEGPRVTAHPCPCRRRFPVESPLGRIFAW